MEKSTTFRITKVPQNFIYPEIKLELYMFGSGQLKGTALREDGDWRPYLPPEEDQNIRGIESSACYVEASQHAIATIEEEQLGEPDNNYAARFNALLSGGTPRGGDPLKGGDSMRNNGLVPDTAMPFGPEVNSWDDFHSWKGVSESAVKILGKKYLKGKKLGYDMVFGRSEPVATKYAKLHEALKYSPCPVSVVAWYEKDGIYYKPEGMTDGHLVELVYIDGNNHPYIRDTYAPYLKKLAPLFNFDFGMRWSVEKNVPAESTESMLQRLIDLIKKSIESWQIPAKPDYSQKLYAVAYSSIGIDVSPDDLASDTLGCAESLSKVIQKAFPELNFPMLLSTKKLHSYFSSSPRFTKIDAPEKGCIILNTTGAGNGKISNGHTGVVGKNISPDGTFWVMSNNSWTGKWDVAYSIKSWVAYFEKIGGMKTAYYKRI